MWQRNSCSRIFMQSSVSKNISVGFIPGLPAVRELLAERELHPSVEHRRLRLDLPPLLVVRYPQRQAHPQHRRAQDERNTWREFEGIGFWTEASQTSIKATGVLSKLKVWICWDNNLPNSEKYLSISLFLTSTHSPFRSSGILDDMNSQYGLPFQTNS